jgi:thioredoxin reductase
MQNNEWDVIILGAGAAGLSAALVLGRARRRVLVVDDGEPRNRFAPHMHGVLGRDGASPADLLAEGRREVERYGVVLRPGTIEQARSEGGGVVVGGMRARALLVATGARDVLPDIPGLAERWGTDAVACPYCDGYESSNSAIGVISGVHQAQLLTQWSSRVTLFTLGADVDRSSLQGVTVDDRRVHRIVAPLAVDVGDELVPLDRIFVATAFSPRDAVLRSLRAERRELRGVDLAVVDAQGATSVPRVWAAGNVVDPSALVPIAMGQGVAAATAINAALTFDTPR